MVCLFCGFLPAACNTGGKEGDNGGNKPPANYVAVTGVTLDKTSIVLEESSVNLHATVTPPDANDSSVTWSSSNSDIANVSKNGNVNIVGRGTVTITVTTNGLKDDGTPAKAECKITVNIWDLGFGATAPDGYGPIYEKSGWIRYEAEDKSVAEVIGAGAPNPGADDHTPTGELKNFYSGGEAAARINKPGSNIANISPAADWSNLGTNVIGYVKFTVNVMEAGDYRVNIIYNGDDEKTILVKLNNEPYLVVYLPPQYVGWNGLVTRQLVLANFNAGENTVRVSGAIGGSGWLNIDCIDIKDQPE